MRLSPHRRAHPRRASAVRLCISPCGRRCFLLLPARYRLAPPPREYRLGLPALLRASNAPRACGLLIPSRSSLRAPGAGGPPPRNLRRGQDFTTNRSRQTAARHPATPRKKLPPTRLRSSSFAPLCPPASRRFFQALPADRQRLSGSTLCSPSRVFVGEGHESGRPRRQKTLPGFTS